MEKLKLDDATNQTSEFGTKNWVELNDEPQGSIMSVFKLNL